MSEPPAAGAILLARHGETNDNREPIRVQGFRDTPLNDTGRRQADELAERVAEMGIVSLWASDLSRARETAEIVGARLGLDVRLDPRLREANRGRWEGYRFVDIEREEPDATPPGGAPARSFASPAASRCASSRTASPPRSTMCAPPVSCRRWSSATAARSA